MLLLRSICVRDSDIIVAIKVLELNDDDGSVILLYRVLRKHAPPKGIGREPENDEELMELFAAEVAGIEQPEERPSIATDYSPLEGLHPLATMMLIEIGTGVSFVSTWIDWAEHLVSLQSAGLVVIQPVARDPADISDKTAVHLTKSGAQALDRMGFDDRDEVRRARFDD